MHDQMIRLREHPELIASACTWFHEKWWIPESAYRESMEEMTAQKATAAEIAAKSAENDFHDRKNLAPNVCAVYVEETYRKQGIAGELLRLVAEDMHRYGIDTLYLVTDHTSFYERYGWRFYCMAQGDGEEMPTRLYIHQYESVNN